MTLIITALAVFWGWEFIVVASPWDLPPWLQPLIVLAMAVGWCWPDWRVGCAAAGLVGIFHVLAKMALTVGSAPVRLERRSARHPL